MNLTQGYEMKHGEKSIIVERLIFQCIFGSNFCQTIWSTIVALKIVTKLFTIMSGEFCQLLALNEGDSVNNNYSLEQHFFSLSKEWHPQLF